jgi:hypothetical protein
MKMLLLVRILTAGLLTLIAFPVLANVNVTATVPGVCGNNIIEPFEQCDGTDFGGQTCNDFNYSGGNLSCTPSCSLDLSQCTGLKTTNQSPFGHIGSGSSIITASFTNNQAVFAGRTLAGTIIFVFRDGFLANVGVASSDGTFSINVYGLSPGIHTFTIYAEDFSGHIYPSQSFTVNTSNQLVTSINGLSIQPVNSVSPISPSINNGKEAPNNFPTIVEPNKEGALSPEKPVSYPKEPSLPINSGTFKAILEAILLIGLLIFLVIKLQLHRLF